MSAPPLTGRQRQRKPLKVVVVGSASVGKTSILRPFVHHSCDPRSTQTTIGCDFWHRNLSLPHRSPSALSAASSSAAGSSSSPQRQQQQQPQPLDVQLQVWDTAGMEQFQSLASSFFRGADGALLVYDLTNADSFQHARTWRDMFVAHAGGTTPILLVGNKLDLADQRVVPPNAGARFIDESVAANGGAVCGAVELTASDADAVERAFIELTRSMLDNEHAKAAASELNPAANDVKRVRLGSLPSSASAADQDKKCSC